MTRIEVTITHEGTSNSIYAVSASPFHTHPYSTEYGVLQSNGLNYLNHP